ncbi:hybrid sensor histidine kinase/response regulator [Fischerella sp. PCC 9605]|uniref:hybrid sensor histidine kinase/response regulator n=1 Tax=Fischerella sp. PCC 9605 TaxID=1173024 RepID=UPI00047AF5E9|nr:ATP-binding protein [Fischerella sp. PCC 9605]
MAQQQQTILIIDDCPEDRQVYRRYILQNQQHHYVILEEETGESALELCRQFHPDCILLDFLLPDMDGLEFLAEFKQQINRTMPAVIMLTGHGNEAVAVQAMKSGVQDYLVKGDITAEHLCFTIQSAIEHVRLHQQLQHSEERFRTSVENMLDCFGIFSAIRNEVGEIVDFRVDYVNAAACEANRMSQKEQLGKRLCEILPGHREYGLFDHYCQVVKTGEPFVKESLTYADCYGKQQLTRAFDIRVTKLGDGFVAAWRDVTKKKQIEEALRESEERYRFLSEAIPQLVWICTTNGECEYLNQRWYEFTGQTVEQAMGFGWLEVVHPDDIQRVMQVWAQSLHTGALYEVELRYRCHDGTYHWYLARALPKKDEQGRIAKWFGTSTDINDRKQLEAERSRLFQLEQAARAEAEAANRAKDEFVAMVSHDLRSPLNAILGWTNLLRTRKQDEATTIRALQTIERNALSQARLLEDLLNMSRILRGKLELQLCHVHLATIIQAALETAYPCANAKNILLKSILDDSVPASIGDPNRLHQVLGNLLSNAIKFTPEGGQVEVLLSKGLGTRDWGTRDPHDHREWGLGEMGTGKEFSQYPITNTQSPIANYAQITVSDTGVGISPDFLPYVFERYRQADSNKQGGLGLGLAIARHIVELHGGTIQAASHGEDKGATFTILLPLRS